jgi:probable HAF family extracellular repeat protein
MIKQIGLLPLACLVLGTLACRDVLDHETDEIPRPVVSVTTEGATSYTELVLGCPAGIVRCFAVDLNEQGQVVGQGYGTDNVYRGFMYDRGSFTDLGSMGGRYFWVSSINNQGQVVGSAQLDEDVPGWPWPVKQQHAWLWEGGTLTDLTPFLEPVHQWGWRFGYASSINEAGLIGGSVLSYQAYARAYVLQGETVNDLGWVGTGCSYSDMASVNNAGDAVGACNVRIEGRCQTRPCLWRDNTLSDIGLPPGTARLYSPSIFLNNHGLVVGSYSAPTGYLVYAWQDGVWSDLGFNAYAVDVNDRNQVAANLPSGDARAVVWQDYELSHLAVPEGFTGTRAQAINNQGIVAGWGSTPDYQYQALMWFPNSLEALIEAVRALELRQGIEVALTATLEAALASVTSDRSAAIQQVEAFQFQVEGMRGKQLTDAEADLLIRWAQGIIDELASG